MCYEIALTCKTLTTSNILLCGSVCIFETTKICLQENILGLECILLAYMIAKRIKISWVSSSWKKWMLLHRITTSRLVSTAFIVSSFQQQNSHEVSSFRICYTKVQAVFVTLRVKNLCHWDCFEGSSNSSLWSTTRLLKMLFLHIDTSVHQSLLFISFTQLWKGQTHRLVATLLYLQVPHLLCYSPTVEPSDKQQPLD